jgi:hypothetical protein
MDVRAPFDAPTGRPPGDPTSNPGHLLVRDIDVTVGPLASDYRRIRSYAVSLKKSVPAVLDMLAGGG